MTELRQRPGDQPLPVPNGNPSTHDLVVEDLAWCPALPAEREAARAFVLERKELGLTRYGSLLQAGNGRDWKQDLAEELADAAAYARQGMEEMGTETDLDGMYTEILHLLCRHVGHWRGVAET